MIYGSSQTDPNYYGYSGKPQATPTPYMSPKQGGNAYVPPGVVGVSIPQNSVPMQSIGGGGTGWSTGQVTPYQAVWGASSRPNPTPVPTPSQPVDPYANINQNTSTGNDQIERDYQDFMNQLGGSEQGLNAQATNATSAVDTNYAPVKTGLQNEQATKLQGLAEQGQVAQTQEKSAMQQSRDLFRQTQQSNIAQMSGLGISSSSVAEALAENLGVETARRIASVSQSANDIYQNLSKEKTNVETYVKQKMVDMEGKIAQEKSNIQLSLMEGLRQINEARATAAKDKANRRSDLLQNANNAIYGLMQNAQTFQQSLEQWSAQNTAGLNSAMSGKDWNAIFSGQLANAPAINGFVATPSYNVNAQGQPTGQINYQKKLDETLANPFAPQQ
jgi:hypothetical protein